MADVTRTPVSAEPGQPVRGKWTMDGAADLVQAALLLRGYADYLEDLAFHGWTLAGPIEDDYGFLVGPDGNTGPDVGEGE